MRSFYLEQSIVPKQRVEIYINLLFFLFTRLCLVLIEHALFWGLFIYLLLLLLFFFLAFGIFLTFYFDMLRYFLERNKL
jgi:hypothetical protein